jgi:hypothetical protein
MTLTTTLRCIAAAVVAGLLAAVLIAMLSGALHPAVAATAGDGVRSGRMVTGTQAPL